MLNSHVGKDLPVAALKRMIRNSTILAPADFAMEAGVSRETLDRLERYIATLKKWQHAINLVSRRSLVDVWRRHVLDSAQLLPLASSDARVWVDLGSGAGFPGLVLAILGAGEVHLVESDNRKCVFLAEAARQSNTTVTIHNCRVEDLPRKSDFPIDIDIITARALADVDFLFDWAQGLATLYTVGLFLKGQDVENELTKSQKMGTLGIEKLPSVTSPDGMILRVTGLSSRIKPKRGV